MYQSSTQIIMVINESFSEGEVIEVAYSSDGSYEMEVMDVLGNRVLCEPTNLSSISRIKLDLEDEKMHMTPAHPFGFDVEPSTILNIEGN